MKNSFKPRYKIKRKPRYNKRIRNKAIIVSVAVMIVVLFTCAIFMAVSALVSNNSSDSPDQTSTTVETTSVATLPVSQSKVFSVASLVHNSEKNCGYTALEKKDDYYKIFYPKTTNKAVDKRASDDAEYFTSLLTSMSGTIKGVDFVCTISEDNLMSVVYELKGYSETGKVKSANYFTRVFNLKKSSELSRESIFDSSFYSYASENVKKYFQNNKDTKSKTDSDTFLKATEANGTNFDRFSFDNQGCTLYFDGKTLFKEDGKLYSVLLKFDDISSYLKIEKNGEQKDYSDSTVIPNIQQNSDIDPSKPMLALTFDDGPSSEITNKILDVLEKYNARATFFVLGRNAKNNTDVLKRQISLGCQIGNHTMGHTLLTKQTEAQRLKDVQGVNDIVKKATGYDVTIVRPPYGTVDSSVKSTLSKYPLILWGVDTLDWSTRDPKSTIKSIMEDSYDGSIVLMHDIYNETAAAVEKAVPKLIEQGYQLVTIDELFYYKGIPLVGGKTYGSAQ